MILEKSKLIRDSFWNFAGVGFLGVAGLSVNFIIARFYGTHDLGVFYQAYAIYIIFSQLSGMGIHTSTVKHTAQHPDAGEQSCIVSMALYMTAVSAGIFTLLLLAVRKPLGAALDSPDVSRALVYVSVGVWCFALNRVFMGFLNGLEKMKAFAVFTFLRGAGLFGSIFAALMLKLEGYRLPVIFSITEALLLPALLVYTRKWFTFVPPGAAMDWARTHFIFGVKSWSTGIVIELQSRADVLILGVFASDRMVGIYSMAAMLFEGLAQIPVVFRRLFDPKITKLVYRKQLEELTTLVRKGALRISFAMSLLCLLVFLVYPFAIKLVTSNPDFLASRDIFAVLSVGMFFFAGYFSFSGLPVQGGFPGSQSLMILATAISNVALNLILIPLYGIMGAAIATSLSWALFVLYFKLFVYRLFKLKV